MQVFVQTLVGGLSFGAIYALIALGFSIVYRTMGLVNFAHGDVLMIGAYVVSTFYLTTHLNFWFALILGIVVTAVLGLFIEGVLRPLEHKDVDLMLIGTIGFGIVLEAAATLIWGTTGRAVATPFGGAPWVIAGIRTRPYDLVVLGVTAIATIALVLFLHHTRRGAAMQAAAMDRDAATSIGIHVGRSNAFAFAIGAGLAALAGGLAGPLLYVSPTMGGSLAIKAFAAAILGGFGNIPGAVIGGLGIGLLDSFVSGHAQGYSDLVVFLVFTVLVMIKPTGLFGEQTVNRA